jgi:hypothetical protein
MNTKLPKTKTKAKEIAAAHEAEKVTVAKRPRAKNSILHSMSCRLEGFMIGALVAGLLAYAGGMQRGEGAALTWCAIKLAKKDQDYQDMSDKEFSEFEQNLKRLKR